MNGGFPSRERQRVFVLPVRNAPLHRRFVLPTISHIFPSQSTATQTSPEVQIRSADRDASDDFCLLLKHSNILAEDITKQILCCNADVSLWSIIRAHNGSKLPSEEKQSTESCKQRLTDVWPSFADMLFTPDAMNFIRNVPGNTRVRKQT